MRASDQLVRGGGETRLPQSDVYDDCLFYDRSWCKSWEKRASPTLVIFRSENFQNNRKKKSFWVTCCPAPTQPIELAFFRPFGRSKTILNVKLGAAVWARGGGSRRFHCWKRRKTARVALSGRRIANTQISVGFEQLQISTGNKTRRYRRHSISQFGNDRRRNPRLMVK